MENKEIEISIVTPMYNEEESVHEFITRIQKAMQGQSYELIVVNDGSRDNTGEILKEYAKTDSNIRYLSLARNRGQSAAVYCGFQHSRGKYVVMMDGDLQNLPEDIMSLVIKIRQGHDLVSGRREDRKESFIVRKLPSQAANWLIRKVTGCTVKDMGGFKCLQGDIARSINIKSGYHRLLPALVHSMGGECVEVNVRHDKRFAGVSKYGTLSRAIDVFFDILLLWLSNASKSRPLYFFGKISVGFLFSSFLIFVLLIIERQFFGKDMGTRPLFIIDIMIFLTGLGVMATGFIIELLSDMAWSQDGRRPYVVRYDSNENR